MAVRAVRVRMYRVGVGDCLLVSFPGPVHMLVDCGALSARPQSDLLAPVIRDLITETDGHVQVVVASHRHQDHIGGFALEDGLWNDLQVDEVWLPWTEDPSDHAASDVRRRQDALARTLVGAAGEPGATLARLSISNPEALERLLHGFRGEGRRRFLSASRDELRTPVLPGVGVQVIGPVRSEARLKALQVSCSLAELSAKEPNRSGPFAARWRVSHEHALELFPRELRHGERLEESHSGVADQLCYWLDNSIDNTSLVLLVRYGRASFLFPGDAQGEAWVPFLEQPELRAALSELRLYKASHHGSYNGTPPRAADGMTRALSLISSASGVLPEVPKKSLLRTLDSHGGSVLRSDQPRRQKGVTVRDHWVETKVHC